MAEERTLRVLVEERFRSAEERIKAAEILLGDGMLIDAVNRIYYAAFNAAKGLLNSIGKDPKSHSGMISEFGLLIIRQKIMQKKYGVILSVKRQRIRCHYESMRMGY